MHLRIVEYGEHPHSKGLQRIDENVARRLVAQFHSLRGRLARRFGGLPVYVGHPDDPEFRGQPGHGDTRAHGWVTALEARPDGLYGRFNWAPTGRELLANAHYKFLSPRWAMRSGGGGTYEPVRLLSIGLTNSPNIPGEAIANEAQPPAVQAAALAAADPAEAMNSAQCTLHNEEGTANSAEATMNKLTLNSICRTADLGQRRGGTGASAIVHAVNARMADTGEDFATAWTQLKRTRGDLFRGGER